VLGIKPKALHILGKQILFLHYLEFERATLGIEGNQKDVIARQLPILIPNLKNNSRIF
jgi:hypothetical protein